MTLLYEEFRFRKAIPVTHEEYLDEPVDIVGWFLEFDRVEAAVEAEQRAKAEGANGGR